MSRAGCAAALVTCLFSIKGGITPVKGGPAGLDSPTSTLPRDRYLIVVQEPVRSDAEVGRRETVSGSAPVEPPLGSRIVVCDVLSPASSPTDMTSGFVAAGQPDLSFDGKRLLFVGKRSESDALDVWEMNIDGTDLRQLTRQQEGCATPVYLSTTFTLDADRSVHQMAFVRAAEDEPVGSLYTCRIDGTQLRRITFNPYGASHPFPISDGRLLYTSWTAPAQQHEATTGSVLMTVHTDGTDVFIFAAPNEAPAVRRVTCETADGWMVYVESAADEPEGGGSLLAVARTRSLHTRRVIAADPDGLYRSASTLGDGKLLVSYRPRRGGSYGLYELDMRSGTRVATVFDTPEWHEVKGLVVQSRPEPAGHSSVVDEGVRFGKLYCMDAYLSDTDESRRIERGQIKKVRVIQAVQETRPARDRSHGHEGSFGGPTSDEVTERTLGEACVEEDGSFFLEVPARMSLRLETLDAEGVVLQAMTSWMWVMPQERRGCIGCHEDRELTPPNRHVYALRDEPRRIMAKGEATVEPRVKPRDPGGDPE